MTREDEENPRVGGIDGYLSKGGSSDRYESHMEILKCVKLAKRFNGNPRGGDGFGNPLPWVSLRVCEALSEELRTLLRPVPERPAWLGEENDFPF